MPEVGFDDSLTRPIDVDEIVPSGAWAVNPDVQGRTNLLSLVAKANSSGAILSLDDVKSNLTSFPKPTDHLPRRPKPSIKGFQLLNEPEVEVAPKPLRPMASVMPENGERTSTLSDMVDQGSTAYPRI